MSSLRARLTAVVVAATLSVSALSGTTYAGTSRPLTDRYCATFSEYFTVSLIVQFVAALAAAFNDLPGDESASPDEEETVDPDEIRATFLVMLSPKFEALTATLARTGPRPLRREFRKQQRIFARGVELLEEAGLTERQIQQIADAEVDQSTYEIEDLTGEVDVDDNLAQRLGRQFLADARELELQDPLSDVGPLFERAATECGVVPSQTVECADVFSEEDAAAIVGRDVTLDDADGCRYVGVEEGVTLAPEVAVVVYDTDRAYENLTKPAAPIAEPVEGIGERAVSFEGFTASGKERTCGRTLVLVDGGRTIVVALCLADDAPVADDQLVEIAEDVIARLGGQDGAGPGT